MVAIIDYDAGNIRSVEKAVQSLGHEAVITRDPEVILTAEHVILPGVGSFGDAMEKLEKYGLTNVVKKAALSGTPFLGICLGEQLLFEESDETPGIKGLGLLKGKVLKFDARKGLKIPQIGWNSLNLKNNGRLFRDIPNGSYVYFVHSYYVKAEDEAIVTAECDYANTAHASVERGNLFACQFHPEKSGKTGLKILNNFLDLKREDGTC